MKNTSSVDDSSSSHSQINSIGIKTEDLKIKNQEAKKVDVYNITELNNKKAEKIEYRIKLTDSDKALLERLDMEHRAKLLKEADVKKEIEKDQLKERFQTVATATKEKQMLEKVQPEESKKTEQATPKVVSVPNPKSKLKVLLIF